MRSLKRLFFLTALNFKLKAKLAYFLEGLIANRLQLNLLITCSAVLPNNAADKPVLPTVPKITNSA